QGLPEQEAFDIEYWLLEEAKLQRMPKPKSLAGRVAFVTGGAGGIGRATAARLVGEGACVVLADIDQAALGSTEAEFIKQFGAEAGIRVNTVNPDAVLRGSKIWSGEWREQRAASSKIEVDDLEEHYRKRSMLKLNVLPEDIAEAIYFLASDLSAKSTGNIINV